MSAEANQRLYQLLPAVYRLRDAATGEPLRALLAVIEDELQLCEAEIAARYANCFIETCEERLVPYLGDLLGLSGLADPQLSGVSLRALVANSLAYRRRKGSAAVIEHVARDATGWYARVVEGFDLLGATQHVDDLRPGQGASIDLRDPLALERLGGPFERSAHLVDVRGAAAGRGSYNLPALSIFLWRLQHYPLAGVNACKRPEAGQGCYSFHPCGIDTPLFNRPQPEPEFMHIAEAINLPGPLRRRALREALVQTSGNYFGQEPVLAIELVGNINSKIAPDQICISDLSAWQRPVETSKRVAVDPELGRLMLLGDEVADEVLVSYSYGFSADIGGGPYGRSASLVEPGPDTDEFSVANGEALQKKLDDWTQGDSAIFTISDSRSYTGDLTIDLGTRRWLAIQAADQQRPCLIGNLVIAGGADNATVTLNGLLIQGTISVNSGIELQLRHCTVLPGGSGPAIAITEGAAGARLSIADSIVGPIRMHPSAAALHISDSIVDGGEGAAISGETDATYAPPTTIERCTIFGSAKVAEIQASNAIFTAALTVERRQSGYVRFSYVPPGSPTPQRYRCQPDLALAEAVRLRPVFTSQRYGDPGYAQLAASCAEEIRRGAADGAEMGVFQQLQQPRREANLRALLDDYLPCGMDAALQSIT